MRATFLIVVLALAGALAWSWMRPAAHLQPPTPVRAAAAPDAPAHDLAPVVARAPAEAASEHERLPTTADDHAPAPSPNVPPADEELSVPRAPSTLVEVRSATSDRLLPSWSWSFVAGERRLRGVAEGGPAELPLPAGVAGDLLVEADGMQPQLRAGVTATGSTAPPLHLRFYLQPAQQAEGVTLIVRDVDGQAVQKLRVDAFALAPSDREAAWHLNAPMWSRVAAAADGRYQLPPLAPGCYGVQVHAVDEQGRPTSLCAFRGTYTLTGSNGFLEDVVLEPGCALRLHVLDAAGAPVDPGVYGAVQLRLHAPGEPGVARRWAAARPDGAGVVSDVDRMPASAPTWLASPVEPGLYTLEVLVRDRVVTRQGLQLAAGAQTERVQLP